MIRQKRFHETTISEPELIETARLIANALVERERGRTGGHVPLALARVGATFGIDEGALDVLRYRAHERKSVQAGLFMRLVGAWAWLKSADPGFVEANAEAAATIEARVGAVLAAIAPERELEEV